jgi:hypothetical protein
MGVNAPLNRKLRMGLVGGGQGAFIGRVHATAAILDNRAVLVAGALSADPAKAKASAPDYDIKPERAYGSYQEMVAAESKLPPAERIDFVSVATPNHTHFDIAKAFAEAGFNVMCDKPLTFDLAQAEELAKIVQRPSTSRAGCGGAWNGTSRSRPAGGPTPSGPGPPAASATSAPTPTTSAGSSPGCCRTRFPAISRRSRKGASSTTTAPR